MKQNWLDAFVVRLANGKNQQMEYKLWAVMQHEGNQYLIMRAEKNPLLMEDIMLLQLDTNEKNSTYTVVNDLTPFAQVLHNTLGVNTSRH